MMSGASIEGRALRMPQSGAILPASCACCGAAAATSASLRRDDGLELIVGYCDDCQHHRTRQGTRTLSIVLSSTLLGLGLSAALPLAWVWMPAATYMLLVLAGASLPLVFALLRERASSPHTSSSVAAWWLADGRLFCTNVRWAAELATLNDTDAELFTTRRSPISAWLLAGVVLSASAAWFFHWLYHPLVRVLNLTETRLEIWVDGRRITALDPTSAETPRAGVEVFLPAGRREFKAISSEQETVSKLSVRLEPGRTHLYAPAAREHCFWLEVQGYGRDAKMRPEYVPLEGEARFWKLEMRVDNWFSENPPATGPSSRLSGGTATALRQARCSEVPYGERNRAP